MNGIMHGLLSTELAASSAISSPGVAAAGGMILLLTGALRAHRKVGDATKEAAAALIALAITIAYLVAALTM